MKRRVSKRRLMYVITYTAAIFSVATVPWSLLALRHVLVVWGTDFDWMPRVLFALLAVGTVGLTFLTDRYIEENGLHLYRHEAAWLNVISMLLLPLVAASAIYVSVHILSVTLMAYALHTLPALFLEAYCFFQLVNLYDRPVRPMPENAVKPQRNPFFLFSLMVLVPAIWLSTTYGMEYFQVGQVHPALPIAASTVVALLIAGALRAIFVEPLPALRKSRTPVPLSPTPPPGPAPTSVPVAFSSKMEERTIVNSP